MKKPKEKKKKIRPEYENINNRKYQNKQNLNTKLGWSQTPKDDS